MKTITEGSAKIIVPEESVRRNSEVFYNPEMGNARDVTVSFLSRFAKKAKRGLAICDPMAASGVRGIRILKEVENVERVVFNDINPEATRLIKKNLELNNIPEDKYEIHNKDCNILFLERRHEFDFIDIDPFGSPLAYLPNIWSALKKNAALAVSATDTGALSGTFTSTCKNRYNVIAQKTDYFKEFAISVLIKAIIQNLSVHDITFYPFWSHTEHYFRVMGTIAKGKEKTSKNLENVNFVSYCPNCFQKSVGIRSDCISCKRPVKVIGPLWTGKTKDTKACKSILSEMEKRGFKKTRSLEMMIEELDIPFYYNLHKICKNVGISPPAIADLFEKLESRGFRASRTHLSDLGFKTDALVKDIEDVLKKL